MSLPQQQRPLALPGEALPGFLPQCGVGNALTLGPDGRHVAIACLKQTGKLVLNATKRLGTVWTVGCLFQTHLVFA